MQHLKWILMAIVVLLLQLPVQALHCPIESHLSQWEYRWGESPKREDGLPLWLLDDSPQGWQRCKDEITVMHRPAEVSTLWLRTRMPETTTQNPCLYFEGSYETSLVAEHYEIYLGQTLLSRASEKPWRLGELLSTFESTVIPLPGHYSGQMLSIRLTANSQPILGINGKVAIGSYRDTLRSVLRRDIDVLILGFFFCVLACLLFLGSWLFQGWVGILSFAAFCLCMGGICISSYNNTSLVFPSFSAWLWLSSLSTLLAPVTFAKFFAHFFSDCSSKLVCRIWQVNLAIAAIVLLLLCGTLFSMGAFFGLLKIALSIYLIVVVVDIAILYSISLHNAWKGGYESRFFAVGFTILVLFLGAFFVDYAFISHPFNHPSLLAWGTLFFILSLMYLMGHRFVDSHSRLEAQHGALNRMWLEVKESRDEIAILNTDLERRVEERSAELESANTKLSLSLQTLQDRQAQLVQSEKMAALGNLVAGIAHEVNTPVGIGVTAASLLEEKMRQFEALFRAGALKKSEFERYLETAIESTTMILANLERAASLMKSFRQVATDQSTEAPRRFRVNEYLSDVLLSLRPRLKRTPHEITIDCDPELEIASYPGALSQIITNLLMNSLIHAYDEGQAGHINIRAYREANAVVFVYEDDGKGIPHWNLPRVFEPFFTTRRGQGGTGLGLNIVFNLAHRPLGGTVDCDSVIGHGARFTLRIPLLEEPIDD